MNLGAGRVVHQDFTRINQAIADGSIIQNRALLSAINATDNTVHILGMLSYGGVHSHQDQLFALIDLADEQNASALWSCLFRWTRCAPQSAAESLEALSDHIGVEIIYGLAHCAVVSMRWTETSAGIAYKKPMSYSLRQGFVPVSRWTDRAEGCLRPRRNR